jgi:hypothetical protein
VEVLQTTEAKPDHPSAGGGSNIARNTKWNTSPRDDHNPAEMIRVGAEILLRSIKYVILSESEIKVEEDDMNGTCSTNGGRERNANRILVG